MSRHRHFRRAESGLGMIEVLVTLVILLVGLLGLAGVLVQSQNSEAESYQRAQAVILMQDMAGRINANRKAASCYAVTAAASGTPYLGNGATVTPACSAAGTTGAQQQRAVQDLADWSRVLQGAAETRGTSLAGAMIGARGCISHDAASDSYLISVAWQGIRATAAPSAGLTCGANLYGSEAQRRVVSMPVRIATLN